MATDDQDNPSPEGNEPKTTDDVELPLPLPLPGKRKKASRSSRFFFRGLATLLPAVLTLWLLVFAYGFIRDKIAAPINWGIRSTVIGFTDWPVPTDEDYLEVWQDRDAISLTLREVWTDQAEVLRENLNAGQSPLNTGSVERHIRGERLAWMKQQPTIIIEARRNRLEKKWNSIAVGQWHVLDMIGLLVAFVLFYFAGVVMSNVLGRQIKDGGEKLIDRVPLIRRVYPAVKQVTDFFFSDNDDEKLKFNRVVAVEYPRKGLYSVGLVTGDTMQDIEEAMGETCLTVFVPSSPTPFTGYVITVPVKDTIDLGISIEDALKFAVSGGVLVPPSQVIHRAKDTSAAPVGKRKVLAKPGARGADQDL